MYTQPINPSIDRRDRTIMFKISNTACIFFKFKSKIVVINIKPYDANVFTSSATILGTAPVI